MVLDVSRQIGYAGQELYKGKGCHIARYKSVGGALFSQAVDTVGGVRDAWLVRHRIYGYLPSRKALLVGTHFPSR